MFVINFIVTTLFGLSLLESFAYCKKQKDLHCNEVEFKDIYVEPKKDFVFECETNKDTEFVQWYRGSVGNENEVAYWDGKERIEYNSRWKNIVSLDKGKLTVYKLNITDDYGLYICEVEEKEKKSVFTQWTYVTVIPNVGKWDPWEESAPCSRNMCTREETRSCVHDDNPRITMPCIGKSKRYFRCSEEQCNADITTRIRSSAATTTKSSTSGNQTNLVTTITATIVETSTNATETVSSGIKGNKNSQCKPCDCSSNIVGAVLGSIFGTILFVVLILWLLVKSGRLIMFFKENENTKNGTFTSDGSSPASYETLANRTAVSTNAQPNEKVRKNENNYEKLDNFNTNQPVVTANYSLGKAVFSVPYKDDCASEDYCMADNLRGVPPGNNSPGEKNINNQNQPTTGPQDSYFTLEKQSTVDALGGQTPKVNTKDNIFITPTSLVGSAVYNTAHNPLPGGSTIGSHSNGTYNTLSTGVTAGASSNGTYNTLSTGISADTHPNLAYNTLSTSSTVRSNNDDTYNNFSTGTTVENNSDNKHNQTTPGGVYDVSSENHYNGLDDDNPAYYSTINENDGFAPDMTCTYSYPAVVSNQR